MLRKLLLFIKYNNAFTIIFVVVFFSFGITFAASPTVRDGVYSSEETLVSIDNTLILSIDLDNYNFNLRINDVTEDQKNYYAKYSYQTLIIENGVWQNKIIEKILTVNKELLDGRDLGLYVANELGENINYELSYLQRVQKLEKEKGESQKVINVEYSGLIGKLLDPKQKVIEGYNPVIEEEVPEVPATVELNPEDVIVTVPIVPEDSAQEENLQQVNEQLVHDVVVELLQNNASSSPETSTSTASSTENSSSTPPQEILLPEASSTPEVIVPETTVEPVPPEVVPEPVEQVPEIVPEVETIPPTEVVPE